MVTTSMSSNLSTPVSPGLRELLGKANAAAIYEASGKQGDIDPAIRSLVPGTHCWGPAFTIKAHAHRSSGITSAIAQAPTGTIIVVDVGPDGGDTCALGGTIAREAQMRGVRGCVTNGRVRDMAKLRELGFPVFGIGTMLRSSRKDEGCVHSVPVVIGGQIVRPGDLIYADEDGVIVVPCESLDALAIKLAKRLAFEEEADARVRAGEPYADAVANRPDLTK